MAKVEWFVDGEFVHEKPHGMFDEEECLEMVENIGDIAHVCLLFFINDWNSDHTVEAFAYDDNDNEIGYRHLDVQGAHRVK